MSGALLVENKLHHEYWRKTTKPTIAVTGATEQAGYEFVNCIDDNAGTSFKVSGGQAVITITFDAQKLMNGFAIYGHNLTKDQGIKIEYDFDTSGGYFLFDDSNYDGVYSETYKPADNSYKVFGANFTDNPVKLVRRLKITTVGWDSDSYISILSMGMWVNEGIEISAPYTPPFFATQENAMKRNNKGNPLLSDVKKVPQKLKINLNQYSEADLYSTLNYTPQASILDDYSKSTINGETKNFPFVELVGYYASRHPFFIMHNVSESGTVAEQKAERDKMYFCTIDNSMAQPRFTSPTIINWSFSALGYMS